MSTTSCSVPGCTERPKGRGRCESHYAVHRKRQIAYGRWAPIYVDARAAREHVTALLAKDLHVERISQLSGVDRKPLLLLINGDPDRKIFPATEAKILSVPVPHIAFQVANGGTVVPSVGTVRRLQALIAYGYPQCELTAHLGLRQDKTLSVLLNHSDKAVLARTARRVAEVFERLQMTPGTSTRSRRRAERNGWALPFAWDEDTIDDPAAEPYVNDCTLEESTRAERAEKVEELTRAGLSAEQIADQLGVSSRTILRARSAMHAGEVMSA